MADVMNQRQRLGEVFMQAKRSRCGTRYLRDLDGVGEPAAKVIRSTTGKHLRLPRKTPKSPCLHNALAVTLERSSRGPKRRRIHTSEKEVVRIRDDRASMKIECHSHIQV
jgi:hypothetical protein